MPIQIAIVEDDAEIRATLSHWIRQSASCRLSKAFPHGELALAEIPELKPNVVLMDINLPGINGVECVRQLKAKMPEIQFIMLTVYEDSIRLFDSLAAGASGYLLKRTSKTELLSAIAEVNTGGSPMTPEIARRVVQFFRRAPEPASEMEKLSPREKDVLEQLSKGFRYKEIEDNLGISAGTLRTYIRNVYEKLHVHSRTEAVVKYLGR